MRTSLSLLFVFVLFDCFARFGSLSCRFLQHKLLFYSFALIIVIGLIRFNKMIGMVVDTIDMSTTAAELMRANRQSNLMN